MARLITVSGKIFTSFTISYPPFLHRFFLQWISVYTVWWRWWEVCACVRVCVCVCVCVCVPQLPPPPIFSSKQRPGKGWLARQIKTKKSSFSTSLASGRGLHSTHTHSHTHARAQPRTHAERTPQKERELSTYANQLVFYTYPEHITSAWWCNGCCMFFTLLLKER